MEYMLAFEQPNLFLVVKPSVEPLLAQTAIHLSLRYALCQMVKFDVGICPDVLLKQSFCVFQDLFKVAVWLDLVFERAPKLLVFHSVALLLQELDYDPQVYVLAHSLHEVLISDNKELFEGHAFFKLRFFFTFAVWTPLKFLIDQSLDLEYLLDRK